MRRDYDLDAVRRTYAVWGRHPSWYFAQDLFSFLGRHVEIRRATVAGLGLRPGDRVLEIGCGNGRNLGYLREAVGASGEVVGVDVTPEMLGEARRKIERHGWSNVRLLLSDAAEADFEQASFDAILGLMSFSAMPRHRAVLEHARAWLRPGGVFGITDGQNFPGRLRILNPLLENVVGRLGTWHSWRDLPAEMFDVFGNVSVRTHNFGSFFVARSRAI